MLENYKETQKVAYKILTNAIKNNKCSHAYLFETGNYTESENFIMSFVKSLLCPHHYTKNENCEECNICKQIDDGNFTELKIIKPDGMQIKKEKLLELQEEFTKKAITGNKKVYIIENAEKLNKSSANSILKFLEEPENDIIAILVTKNIYEVINTIRSRCQIISFKEKQNVLENISTIENLKTKIYNNQDVNEITITKTIEFVNYYEKNHMDTLLYVSNLWNSYIKDKEELEKAFEIMILYYKDILNYKLKRKLEVIIEEENLKQIAQNNQIEQLCQKISKIIELKNRIKYNANTALLMDKLIIELEGEI